VQNIIYIKVFTNLVEIIY